MKINKTLLGIAVVAVLVAAFGSAGYVYAQAPTPETPGTGYGSGMGSGRESRGVGMMDAAGIDHDDEILHDTMMAVYSEKLGISVTDLEARLDAGEHLSQIASSEGLTMDEFFSLMTEARTKAIEQAVNDGTLTQEQADLMNQQGVRMGGRGRGDGQRHNNNMDCPVIDSNL